MNHLNEYIHPRLNISLVMLCLLALASCNSEDGAPPNGAPPTWHQDIAPFVSKHCASCHNNDNGFAFPLTSFSEVEPLASWMLIKMQGADSPPYFMPPFGARDTEECIPPAPWKDDNRPTDAELDTFAAWVEAGTPEGDEATAAPIIPPEVRHLTGADIETYAISGTTLPDGLLDDQYLCFPIDPARTADSWVTGLEVLPDNTAVVHHVVVFTDPLAEGPALAGAEGSYPCFGGPSVSDTAVLFAWAPGGQPMELADEIGALLPANGRFVVQMHYHPTGSMATDATSVAVRWATAEPSRTAEMRVFGGVLEPSTISQNWEDPPFSVPANAPHHVETWVQDLQIPIGVDVRLFAVFPHMHLAGTDIKVSIDRAGGDVCLSHNPRWDFEWQRTYLYDGEFAELPQLQPGDALRIRCTFNNSESNPILMKYIDEAAISDVGVGEDSFDEMCTAIIGVVY